MTIGDCVSYDADPGIKAVLESTETVNVENRSFGGVGLTQKGFQSYLEESLLSDPEVMTVMVGGWDLAFAEDNQKEYEKIIENSIEEILKVSFVQLRRTSGLKCTVLNIGPIFIRITALICKSVFLVIF